MGSYPNQRRPVEVVENRLNAVRGAFVTRGTTLAQWCAEHGVDRSWASRALRWTIACEAATRLRRQVMEAAGVE